MPNNNLENPFKQSEDWQPWFELDRSYLKHFGESLNNYLKFHNLNLIKNNYMPANSILTWITKHSLLAIIIGITIFSTITASAAQIFLPPEIKPTRLLNIEKSSSSSKSSVQSSSLSSSISSSVSSTKTSSLAANSQPKTQTYTNEYFPDLKIVYDEAWKFETTTQETKYKGYLVTRIITLTKNNLTASIKTFLLPEGIGCENIDGYKVLNEFTSGFKKFLGPENKLSYSKVYNCPNILTSNSKANSIPDYKGPQIDGNVVFGFVIELSGNYKNDDLVISDFDKIMAESSLR
ncbi:MAG: hypothetical protein WCK98_03865 [bacterium]